jgi:opacity protein-like surface antigen
MLKIVALIVGALILGVGPAFALENSLAIKIGYHHFLFPGEDSKPDGDGVLEDGEFDGSIDTAAFNGWTVEGEYDMGFHELFSLGLSIQWYGGTSKWVGVTENATVKGDMMLSLTNFLVTPKLHLPLGPVDLHTGAGVGIYWLIENFAFEVQSTDGGENITIAESANRLGYHIQIGCEYKIRDWAGLIIEDRFAFAKFYGSDPSTNFDELEAGGNSFFLGARFHF